MHCKLNVHALEKLSEKSASRQLFERETSVHQDGTSVSLKHAHLICSR